MIKKKEFQDWFNEFSIVFDDMYEIWKDAREKEGRDMVKLPRGFHEYILAQYTAYNNEIQTRKLVWATWGLAIATIILTIINLFLK